MRKAIAEVEQRSRRETFVVDASVVIKWLLQDPQRKAGTDKATRLLEQMTRPRMTPKPSQDSAPLIAILQLCGTLRGRPCMNRRQGCASGYNP
jgi:hypothetical protein